MTIQTIMTQNSCSGCQDRVYFFLLCSGTNMLVKHVANTEYKWKKKINNDVVGFEEVAPIAF